MLVLLGMAGSVLALDGARYLIIAPDSYCPVVQQLADWKTEKGMFARIVPLSVAGGTPEAVHTFIQTAWSQWPVRPEYVLLAAAPSQLPGCGTFQDNDSRYGDMTGDYLQEIPVGRLPAEDVHECSLLVAKCLAFEKPAPGLDTSWYMKGTTCISEDSPPDQYYQPDSRRVRNQWVADGYLVAESLSSFQGSTSTDVNAAARDGRMYITYRGTAGGYWWIPFHYIQPWLWNNGAKVPVVVGATCETVTLAAGEHMYGDEFIRAGSVDSLGGAVAYLGTSQSGNSISEPRSLCYRGFFDAVFLEHAPNLGTALLRGKIRMDSVIHDQDRYEEWCLLGDPDLPNWTSVPQPMAVTHDTSFNLANQSFPVTVLSHGAPVAGAVVCVSMDTTVYYVDTTDASGSAVLSVLIPRPGTLRVVVTGRNLRPYEGTCRAWCTGAVVRASSYVLSDAAPGGNGDSCIVPGETSNLVVTLRNYGTQPAHATTARLRSADPYVTLLDTAAAPGLLPPGDTVTVPGFRFAVSADCPLGHPLNFDVACSDSAGDEWSSNLGIIVGTYNLRLVGAVILDTAGNNNSRLDPDESASYVFTLANDGYGSAARVRAVLRSDEPGLVVTDSVSDFGPIAGRSGATDANDCFTIRALHIVPETHVTCSLCVHAPAFDTAIALDIVVGRLGMLDPVPDGPRAPALYYAYDNIDVFYPERPTYSWVELRGTGTALTLADNQTVPIGLPDWFGPIAFYGSTYDTFSVCTNGWLAAGTTAYNGWSNRTLPASGLPPMVAVSWDDFLGNSRTLYRFDSLDHRLIVEWDSVPYRTPPDGTDEFEVIVYDSTRYSEQGQTRFLVQYRTLDHSTSCTVGLQSPTSTIGLTDLYNGVYHRAAGTLGAGRCILFTTDHPIVGITNEERITARATGFSVYPSICRPGSTIRITSAPSSSLPHLLRLYSPSGRLVGEFDIRHWSFVIPDEVPSGLYFIRLGNAVAKLLVER